MGRTGQCSRRRNFEQMLWIWCLECESEGRQLADKRSAHDMYWSHVYLTVSADDNNIAQLPGRFPGFNVHFLYAFVGFTIDMFAPVTSAWLWDWKCIVESHCVFGGFLPTEYNSMFRFGIDRSTKWHVYMLCYTLILSVQYDFSNLQF